MAACNSRSPYHFSAVVAFLALLHITSHMKMCSAARPITHTVTNTEFIRTSCINTTYPRLCYESLSSYAASIQTSPKEMAHTALSVSLTGARSTSAMMSRLLAGSGMKPREVAATKDCFENLSDSIDELRQSIGEMGHLRGPDFDYQMNSIQTWVSASLTSEDTCMDGFAGNAMNGKIKDMVRGRVVNVAQLTSNALALINSLASIGSKSP